MKTEEFKYAGRIYIKPQSNDPAYIGCVYANSIKALRERARMHARNWNHWGKLCLEDEYTGKKWFIIA